MGQIIMKPQDVVILLKKVTPNGRGLTGKGLAESLDISQSEVSESLERSRKSGLLNDSKRRVNTLALRDFLLYGIRYCFAVEPSGIVRGVPTAISSEPVKSRIVGGEEAFVWPYDDGEARGQGIQPLYPSVPSVIQTDPAFYALLAMVDVLRIGRTREREIAVEIIDKYLNDYAKQ